jgi:hypothetical protein
VPFDDGTSRILENLLPVLEARLVLLRLVPAQLDLADRVSAADQIVITNLIKKNEEISLAFSIL